jgi:glycosyltransferase involved in cell wall biosynthesis
LSEIASEVNVVDLKSSRILYSILGLAKYLRMVKPTILLSTEIHVNIAALIAKKLAQVNTHIILRESNTFSALNLNLEKRFKTSLPIKIAPFVYPWADGYIAVSQGVAEDMISSLNIRKKKVHVVYNPVFSNELFNKKEEPVDHPWFKITGVPVILGAGRLSAQKDFNTLIRAFAIVRKVREAKLIILGEGSEFGNLKNLAVQLKIDKDVDLPGFVENPFAYMNRARLFVLSSKYEGLPGVLIQAMACGCPVISTDCPSGPREILADGKFGPLIPVGDPLSMAKAMDNMLDKKPDSALLIQRASNFSLEKAVEGYLSVFSSVNNPDSIQL